MSDQTTQHWSFLLLENHETKCVACQGNGICDIGDALRRVANDVRVVLARNDLRREEQERAFVRSVSGEHL